MAEEIGARLWRLRTEHGLSLAALAQRAGVSKATLSQWETGKRQPRIPELEAVLDALNVSAARRAVLLAALAEPRALRRLRQVAADDLGTPPHIGDLLRALRLRRRWTQEQTGKTLGVDRTTVVHWERGSRRPSGHQIQALCFALHAREDELIALTTERFVQGPLEEGRSWQERAERIAQTLLAVFYGQEPMCQDLSLWSLQREAWLLAAQNEGASPVLSLVLTYHAEYQCEQERWDDSRALSQRVLRLSRDRKIDPDMPVRAALVRAESAVYGGHAVVPERGRLVLQEHLHSAASPAVKAWLLSDLADYVSLEGQRSLALHLAEKAIEIAQTCENTAEVYLRRRDYARLLLRDGRSGEALTLAEEPVVYGRLQYARDLLLLTEAHLQEGHLSEAQDWLVKARDWVTQHQINQLHPRIERLTHQL